MYTQDRQLNRKNNNDQGRTAVRETGISCHHGWQLRTPSEKHITIALRALRGALNWVPIMPRDVIFVRADVFFSHSGPPIDQSVIASKQSRCFYKPIGKSRAAFRTGNKIFSAITLRSSIYIYIYS